MNSGIYIHIPFCEKKCGYCDFYSVTELDFKQEFLDCLEKEITLYAKEFSNEKIFDTIYFGGGTPSLLLPGQIYNILNLLTKYFKIDSNSEITLEVNPGTISQQNLLEFKNDGVNRLSIGVQSFYDAELQFLGRIHNADQSIKAIQYAKEAEYKNISIDLIYAMPNQKIKNWELSLNKTIELNPEHIAAYNLTIEKNTPFYDLKKNGKIKSLSESQEKEFFNITHSTLANSGYIHYEVSNFARGEEFISKHNYKYWQHIHYIGFGPSAHSFWNNQRWSNYSALNKYISFCKQNKKPIDFTESLKSKDLEFEYIFLSLRTYKGLNLKKFREKFHFGFADKYKSIFSKLIKEKYAEINTNYFKLTNKGMMICDEILPLFIKN